MDDTLRIYVDRLKDGHKLKISEQIGPSLIGVCEGDLTFKDSLALEGEVYLVENELVLHLDVSTRCFLPCSVCNEAVMREIKIVGAYQPIEIAEIKGAIFDMSDLIREMVLLEVPGFVECQGACPKRKEVEKFLKKEGDSKVQAPNPFSGLSLDEFKKIY